jgi:putative addiction module component (TIGR02574 family)
MKTFTVCVQGDNDTELLKKFLEVTKFNDEIETYEDGDDFSSEDIAELDRRLAEYERDPTKRISSEDFRKEMKQKYGV